MIKSYSCLVAGFLLVVSVCFGELDHTSDGKYITITGGEENEPQVRIPSTIDGLPVKVIAKNAFGKHAKMKELDLPDGLETIEDGAFGGCTSLRSVKLPEGVKTIGAFAFNYCTDLDQVSLPDSLVSIGDSAFGWCKIVSIQIPRNVVSIGECPFDRCNKLKEIDVSKENSAFTAADGMLIGKKKKILIQCPAGKRGAVIIPDGVEVIGKWAFGNCERMTHIEMPDSLTTIEDMAFQFSGLREVNFPSNLKTIGKMAFLNCVDLKEVTLPSGLKTIGKDAFRACSRLKPLNIPSGVKVESE